MYLHGSNLCIDRAPNYVAHFATPLEDDLCARMLGGLTVCLLALLYKLCKNAAGTDPVPVCIPFQSMKNIGVTDHMLVFVPVTVHSHNMPPIGLGAQGSPRTGQESRRRPRNPKTSLRPENSKWRNKDCLQAPCFAPLPKPCFLTSPRPAGPRRTLKAMG